ncbi:PP0621 family protein [Ottowia pentelensis]|uniref:PP0621 family protein n=1 Tax=Ottowia pentelensis TaxID=511108 RepID=A0ABV6PXU1_9BURK
MVLLVVLFGVWLWRRGRRLDAPPAPPPPRSDGAVQPMVACARCGVHVPQSSAVSGRAGLYCCEAHRREAEGG